MKALECSPATARRRLLLAAGCSGEDTKDLESEAAVEEGNETGGGASNAEVESKLGRSWSSEQVLDDGEESGGGEDRGSDIAPASSAEAEDNEGGCG